MKNEVYYQVEIKINWFFCLSIVILGDQSFKFPVLYSCGALIWTWVVVGCFAWDMGKLVLMVHEGKAKKKVLHGKAIFLIRIHGFLRTRHNRSVECKIRTPTSSPRDGRHSSLFCRPTILLHQIDFIQDKTKMRNYFSSFIHYQASVFALREYGFTICVSTDGV